jgi:tagatose 1,6-diphosphate aldolase
MSPGGAESVVDIEFIDPGVLVDGDLELRLLETTPADHERGFEPTYRFAMTAATSGDVMGTINLRVGHSEHLTLYRGHIGFGVEERFRGNRFALRSCRLLAGLVRHHSVVPIWLTCNDGNMASRRTLELLGAEFVDIRTMPADYPYVEYYPPESRTKRRYRWMAPAI